MAKKIRIFSDFLKRKSEKVDSKLSKYVSYVDDWYDGLTGRKKYILEVTLKFPLVVIMYLLMNGIAPYYNSWLLDAPFLIVRYFGLLLILTRFISSFENLLPLYMTTCTVYASSVVSQYVYWISRSAAEEACFPEAFGPYWNAGDLLWAPTIFAIVLRLLCMFHLFYYSDDAVLMTVPLVSSLLTLLMSLTSWYIVAEVDYLANGFFLMASLLMIIARCHVNDKSCVYKKIIKLRFQLAKEEDIGRRKQVDDLLKYYKMKSIHAENWNDKLQRDVSDLINTIFAIFSMTSFLVNLSTRLWSLLYKTDNDYLELNHLIDPIFSSLSESCNDFITFIGLAFVFGNLFHISTYAINKFLNVAQPNFYTLRYQVVIFFVLASVDGGIIFVDVKTREINLEGVLLTMVFQMIFLTIDNIENQSLGLANAVRRIPPIRLVKLGFVLATITIGPTFFVITHASPADWHLFNLTGNFTVLIRAFFLLLECFLLWISWRSTQLNDKIQSVLDSIRVIKRFSILTSSLLTTYYRVMAPFFVAFFWLHVVLNIVWGTLSTTGFIYNEWTRYKIKNDLLDFLSGLPNAMINEDNTECSLCYNVLMFAGKELPCGHVFHHDCLKRWFQVQNVCPYCNTAMYIP